MSTLYVDNLQPNLGSQVEIPALKPLAGSIINVQVVRNSTEITSSTAGNIDLGLEITITPASTSSKFLLFGNIHANLSTASSGFGFRLFRNETLIVHEDIMTYTPTAALRNSISIGSYIDVPSTTNAITYKLMPDQFSGTIEYNETGRGVSTFTLMEIAQ